MAGRRRHVRRWVFSGLVMALGASYVGYTLTQPIAALQPTSSFSFSRPAITVPLTWPAYGEAAVGAMGYGVLDTHGPEQPLPTASTIKVLTALCVLTEKPLALGEAGPTITLTADDTASYDKYIAEAGSVVHVAVGEQLTERQALEALLLPSANNIAETLVRWAFGSIDAYNLYANSYAKQLGMTQTTVTDPSGFMPSTTSTPRDLVLLGLAAMGNVTLQSIVGESTAAIPVHGTVHNVNIMLGRSGIVGIKTGNSDQDMGAYIFASQQSLSGTTGMIVGAVMNGPNLFAAMRDSVPLINSAAAGFSKVTIVKAGSKIGAYTAPWQPPVDAIAPKDVSVVAWNGSAIRSTLALHEADVPTKANTTVGTISLPGSAFIATPVVLKSPIEQPNIFWRLTHPF